MYDSPDVAEDADRNHRRAIQEAAMVQRGEELDLIRLGHAIAFLKAFNGPNRVVGEEVDEAVRSAVRLVRCMFTEVGDDDDADD